MIEDLILNGGLEVAGIDVETGELLYTFTDKLKDVNPELHKEFTNYFHSEMMSLWVNGFIEMDVTGENPQVFITDKAMDESEISKLSKENRLTLKEIIKNYLK
ncbi:MAG: hypothetical protein RLZZ328_1405 [Bacteroidota bacterium]